MVRGLHPFRVHKEVSVIPTPASSMPLPAVYEKLAKRGPTVPHPKAKERFLENRCGEWGHEDGTAGSFPTGGLLRQ